MQVIIKYMTKIPRNFMQGCCFAYEYSLFMSLIISEFIPSSDAQKKRPLPVTSFLLLQRLQTGNVFHHFPPAAFKIQGITNQIIFLFVNTLREKQLGQCNFIFIKT